MEEWREIPGWQGYYVSDGGNVRGRRGRVLKPQSNYRNEYRYVSLARADGTGKTTSFNVHRLVLEAFVGARPEGMTGSHRDGDKSNNRLSNLLWEPHGDNMRRQREHGTQRDQRGSRNSMAKLSEEDVRKVRERLAHGDTQASVARTYSVSVSLVHMIHAGKIWRHVA